MIKRTLFWVLIFIFNTPLFSKAQTETQTQGIIINKQGKAVAGVSVQNLQTNRGTITDATGKFSLSSRIGDTLSFTIVGYQNQLLIVTNIEKPLNIILKESENDALNDVIVIGYGTTKKQNLIAAQSTYDAKNIGERPINRIDQALIGQLPGVQVRQQSGMPGNGLSILIRGSGSLFCRYRATICD